VIVLVDNEHVTGYAKPWGERMMAARVRIKYDLEDMSGRPCLIIRWDRVTPELLRSMGAIGVFISGNSTPADAYAESEVAGLHAAVRTLEWPVFGFCGGHQVVGQAFGAPLEPIGELDEGAESFGEAADLAPGMKHELGYLPVEITRPHPLLNGLGSNPVMRHAHSWELKAVPPGFTNYAATEVSPIQLIIHDGAPIVGTQFHPEYSTDDHPAGKHLIRNFMHWSGLVRTGQT
jgi:GMP synthase-like glutamine amidotransferase